MSASKLKVENQKKTKGKKSNSVQPPVVNEKVVKENFIKVGRMGMIEIDKSQVIGMITFERIRSNV